MSFIHTHTRTHTQSLLVKSNVNDNDSTTTTTTLQRLDRKTAGTPCVILCPTRELASQTASVVETLGSPWWVGGCLSGGEKRKSEKQKLRKGVHVLVATPGRLLDHLQKTESLLLSLKGKVRFLVLDEADRLLQDAGLCSQVQTIVQRIRANQPGSGPKRDGVTWTSVLVSATLPPQLEKTARGLLRGHEAWTRIVVRHNESNSKNDKDGHDKDQHHLLEQSTPRQLRQLHMTVTAKLRLTSLLAFLVQRVHRKERVVVFLSTCDGVDFHHALLSGTECILNNGNESMDDRKAANAANNNLLGCPLYRLHGNVPHAQRQAVLRQFNNTNHKKKKTMTSTTTGTTTTTTIFNRPKEAAVLLATDVAARGLNLTRVDWTVQYDPPCEVSDYAHRAGRTARAGQAGHSLLFLLPSESGFLRVLETQGMAKPTALSLHATLQHAAKLCPDLVATGNLQDKDSVGGYNDSNKDKDNNDNNSQENKDVVDDKDNTSRRGDNKNRKMGETFCTVLQRKLEEVVEEDDAKAKQKKRKDTGVLLTLARQAYVSFVRSYPTKEKAVKHIFSARGLHLGHTARAFCLKEPPKTLTQKVDTATMLSNKAMAVDNKRMAFQAFALEDQDESGEGLEADEAIESSLNKAEREDGMTTKKSKKQKRSQAQSMGKAKRNKKARTAAPSSDSGGGNTPKNGRQLMLERAKQLQHGGMDSF